MGWMSVVWWMVGTLTGVGGSWLLHRRQRSPQPAIASHLPNLATLQQQLQQTQLAYHMATEMSQFRAGFLARTSHELRSPLNSVISLHQLILSDLCEDAAEEREFVAQAHTAALKMLALLDELINIAKAIQGTNTLDLQPVQLSSVLEEVRRLTYLQAQNRNLRLQIELPEPTIYVLADPRWLQQILVNLISTPIALMQEGKIRLTTHLAPDRGELYIWVEDERPVSAWSEPVDRLRLPEDTTPVDTPSSGLTLLLNQMLLERMKGRLEILASPVAPAQPDAAFTRIQCAIPLASDAAKDRKPNKV